MWSNHFSLSEMWAPPPWPDCASIFLFFYFPHGETENCELLRLPRCPSRDLFLGALCFCVFLWRWISWSNLLLTLSSTPLLHCFATLSSSSSSPSFPPPSFLSPPSIISHFSWTPPMRYSVYRRRYGRLSLLTVIPSWPFPVSSVRCSLSNRQEGSLLLCGLRSLNVQYRPLMNVFVLFPLGNKAM